MNHYNEILKHVDCLSKMKMNDFGGMAKIDIVNMNDKGALFYALDDSELMLVAYSDEFGRSKNIVRWYKITEKPIERVALLEADDAFDLIPEQYKGELIFHLELFSETVPRYIKDVVGSNDEVPLGLPRQLKFPTILTNDIGDA